MVLQFLNIISKNLNELIKFVVSSFGNLTKLLYEWILFVFNIPFKLINFSYKLRDFPLSLYFIWSNFLLNKVNCLPLLFSI